MINKELPQYLEVIVGENPISRIPNPQVASSILAGGTRKSQGYRSKSVAIFEFAASLLH